MAGVGAVLDIRSLQENCANCSRSFASDGQHVHHKSYMKNARVSAFVYHDKGRQITKQVVDGLGETLKFHWLKLDRDGKDFPIVLCYDCSLTFTQLFEFYKNFLGKQTPGSMLSVINERLNDLFDKYDTPSLYNKVVRDYLIKHKKGGIKKVPGKRKLLGPARFRNKNMGVEAVKATSAAPAEPMQKQKITAEPIHTFASEPTHKFASEPTYKFASEPTQNFASEPTQKFASEPTQKFASEPAPKFASEPTHTVASDEPIHTFASKPTHTVASEPIHTFASKPTHRFTSEPTHKFALEPTHTVASEPIYTFASKPTHRFTSEPTHKFALEPTHTFASESIHTFASETIHMIEAEYEDVNEGPRESVGQMGIRTEERVSVPVTLPTRKIVVSSAASLKRPRSKKIYIIRTESLANKKPNADSSQVIRGKEVAKYECPVCCREFPSAFRLECHQNYCKVPNEQPQQQQYQCDECGMILLTERSLATHKRSSHPCDQFVKVQYKYSCTHPGCDVTFDAEDEREMHMYQHMVAVLDAFPSKSDGSSFSENDSIDPLM